LREGKFCNDKKKKKKGQLKLHLLQRKTLKEEGEKTNSDSKRSKEGW